MRYFNPLAFVTVARCARCQPKDEIVRGLVKDKEVLESSFVGHTLEDGLLNGCAAIDSEHVAWYCPQIFWENDSQCCRRFPGWEGLIVE